MWPLLGARATSLQPQGHHPCPSLPASFPHLLFHYCIRRAEQWGWIWPSITMFLAVLSRGRSGQVLPGVLGHSSITISSSQAVTTRIPKAAAQALPLAPCSDCRSTSEISSEGILWPGAPILNFSAYKGKICLKAPENKAWRSTSECPWLWSRSSERHHLGPQTQPGTKDWEEM